MTAKPLRPVRGRLIRAFGCGWFIRQFLLGKGPEGSIEIDPKVGVAQTDINYQYKEALTRSTARERSEKIISRLVLSKGSLSEEEAEEIYRKELKKLHPKTSHMRYHSFLMYFSVLKKLGWVEETGQTEISIFQNSYPTASNRIYYRLTEKGITASQEDWSNPLFTLYPDIGHNHTKGHPETKQVSPADK